MSKVKKIVKNVGLFFLTGVFCLVSVPAFADVTYTPVSGTSCKFKKYLIVDAGDNIPNVSFNFTVEAGQRIAASATTMEVTPGIGTPTIATVTFADTDTTLNAIADGDIDVARGASARVTGGTASTGVEFETGEKYAKKEATIDFSSISFTEPGIYRYIVKETASTDHANAGIMHDTDIDRVLDVYVTDNGNGTLVVSSYVMHTDVSNVSVNSTMGPGDVTNTGDSLDDKTDGFTNEYNTKDLAFKKTVTGNAGSRDKYFEFTVKATNLNASDKFTVSLANDNDESTNDGNADTTSGTTDATRESNRGKTNVTTVTGSALSGDGVKFYLQHGQSIVIRGLPANSVYTVTEDAEDYKSTASGATDYTDATTGTIGTVAGTNKMVKTSFVNQRDGVIPMGVAHMVGISVGIVMLIGFLGIIVLLMKRKNANNVE